MNKHDPDFIHALGRQALIEASRQGSFRAFCALVMPEILPAYAETPLARILFEMIDRINDDRRRWTLAAPPRHGKSTLLSGAYPAFKLGLDPSMSIVCASYNDQLANDLALISRRIMESDVYREIFPWVKLESAALGNLVTSEGGSRFATSVGGTLTGKGADLLLIDDPLKGIDAASVVMRDKAFNWLIGEAMSRLNKPSEAEVIATHQRLHQDDPIGRLKIMDAGFEHIAIPALIDVPTSIPLMSGGTLSLPIGKTLWPEQFSVTDLKQIENANPEYYWAAYQQRPIPVGGGLFPMSKIKRYERRSFDFAAAEALVMSIDPAVSTKAGASHTGITTWAIKGRHVYLMRAIQRHWSLPDQYNYIMDRKEHSNLILIEHSPPGIGLFAMLYQNGGLRQLQYFHPGKFSKADRAQHAAMFINRGIVHFPVEEEYGAALLEHQMVNFSEAGENDVVDSMTQLFFNLLHYTTKHVTLAHYESTGPLYE